MSSEEKCLIGSIVRNTIFLHRNNHFLLIFRNNTFKAYRLESSGRNARLASASHADTSHCFRILNHRGEKENQVHQTHLTLQLPINPWLNPLDLYFSLKWVKEQCENAPKASM